MKADFDVVAGMLRLLSAEGVYPSRLGLNKYGTQFTHALGLTPDEVFLHLQVCIDEGLIDGRLEPLGSGGGRRLVIKYLNGLTAKGQRLVSDLEQNDGKWLALAKARLGEEGVAQTVSNVVAWVFKAVGENITP